MTNCLSSDIFLLNIPQFESNGRESENRGRKRVLAHPTREFFSGSAILKR